MARHRLSNDFVYSIRESENDPIGVEAETPSATRGNRIPYRRKCKTLSVYVSKSLFAVRCPTEADRRSSDSQYAVVGNVWTHMYIHVYVEWRGKFSHQRIEFVTSQGIYIYIY